MILSRQRRRTGTGLSFTKTRVKNLRVSRGIPAYQTAPETLTTDGDDAVVVTVAEAQSMLGVGKVTIYRWLTDGFLTGEQLTAGAAWRVRIDRTLRDRLAPSVAEGWVGLADAAKPSGSPAKPCCTRSNAVNSRQSTSTKDDEKAYGST